MAYAYLITDYHSVEIEHPYSDTATVQIAVKSGSRCYRGFGKVSLESLISFRAGITAVIELLERHESLKNQSPLLGDEVYYLTL